MGFGGEGDNPYISKQNYIIAIFECDKALLHVSNHYCSN